MGGCWGVCLSSHLPRRSTEKEPEKAEITKNKERTRKEKLVRFGWYAAYAVPLGDTQCRRYLSGDTQCRRYLLAVSSIAGTWLAEAEKTKIWRHFFGRNAIRR